jgi:hypothetical protein
MFELLGWSCVADDAACAVWSVVAFCCDDCTPPVPGADCVAACEVGAVLAALPADEASFDCVDEPVLGAALAGAAAPVPAACIAPARTSSSLPDVRPVGAAQPQPGLCAWVAFCVVVPVFAAVADDDASFDCETEPSLPGLSTRTEMFWFVGSTWVALDAATAAWSVDDDCVADCTGVAASAVPVLAAKAANVAASVVINRRFIEELLWYRWYRAR